MTPLAEREGVMTEIDAKERYVSMYEVCIDDRPVIRDLDLYTAIDVRQELQKRSCADVEWRPQSWADGIWECPPRVPWVQSPIYNVNSVEGMHYTYAFTVTEQSEPIRFRCMPATAKGRQFKGPWTLWLTVGLHLKLEGGTRIGEFRRFLDARRHANRLFDGVVKQLPPDRPDFQGIAAELMQVRDALSGLSKTVDQLMSRIAEIDLK